MVKNLIFLKIQISGEKFRFSYLNCKIGMNPINSEQLAAMHLNNWYSLELHNGNPWSENQPLCFIVIDKNMLN